MRLWLLRFTLVLVPISMALTCALAYHLGLLSIAAWLWMDEHEMQKHLLAFSVGAVIAALLVVLSIRDGFLITRRLFKEISAFKG